MENTIKINKAERARDAYAAASALGFQQMADAEVANLARELGINPDIAQRLIQMPEGIWKGIRDTITLPGAPTGK